MARQLVDAQLIDSVPQTAEQVDAQHILVATQELAQQLYQQVTGGADFDAIARANSIDTLTAPTGGQLGWFTRLEVDPAFADVAFTLDPGKISEPVQTPFGWHIIKVIARNPDRALSASQYQLAVDHATSSWLDDQRAQAAISNDHGAVTPTPTQGSFVPPPDAPTMVPPTPIPVTPTPTEPFIGPEPVTPGAIEEATPVATPVVSTPIANATPIASPSVATPVASPIVATPEASPAAA